LEVYKLNKGKKSAKYNNHDYDGKRLSLLLNEARRLKNEMREIREKAIYIWGSWLSNCAGGKWDKRDRYMDYMILLEELEEAMLLNMHKIMRERLKLEKAIGKIGDTEMRLIARLRVINGLSWERIGEEVNTERSAAAKKFYDYSGKL